MLVGKKGRDEGYGRRHGSCVQVGIAWESVAGYVGGKEKTVWAGIELKKTEHWAWNWAFKGYWVLGLTTKRIK